MSNELQTTGNKEIANQSQHKEVDNRVKNLEEGGYYKNVISPEEYLSKKNIEEVKGKDLELTDELNNVENKDKIKPLKHWKWHIQDKFEKSSPDVQKAWIDSFKIVEKGYNKQLQEYKDDIIEADKILGSIDKYIPSIRDLGKEPHQYIRELIEFDDKLGKDPVYEIARLILVHRVKYDEISEIIDEVEKNLTADEYISKHINPLKEEISRLKGEETPQYVEDKSDEIVEKITKFYDQTDSSGKLKYPNAIDNIEDILELVKEGENLDRAYYMVINEKDGKKDRYDEEEDLDYDVRQTKRNKNMTPQEQEREMLKNMLNKLRG